MFDRVDGVQQLRNILAHMLVVKDGFVIAIKIGIEIDDESFMTERLTPIRYILGGTGGTLLLLIEVLKGFAVDKIQHQKTFIRTGPQTTGIRHHHFGILKTRRIVIDHQVQQVSVSRLIAHVDIISVYLIIELPHRYLQFRTLLAQGEDECP